MSSELIQDANPVANELVVLVDPFGRPRGTRAKASVHTADTPLHLAFSVYLFDHEGRVLLTRRALAKSTWPGVWSNSCCGHLRPGETAAQAVRRRTMEELGVRVSELTEVLPDFRYRAVDHSGVMENEICPVFAAVIDPADLRTDPDEVAAISWTDWQGLVDAATQTPFAFSPWSVLQIRQLAERLPARFFTPEESQRSLSDCIGDVDDLLRAEIAALDQRWCELDSELGADVLAKDLPGWLSDLLMRGGKRLRVSMAYWGYIAAGGVTSGHRYQNLVRIGAALETLHLFGLIQDDVMDESTTRRGRPAAHVQAAEWHQCASGRGDAQRFGESLAVLLGDLAHTLADHLVDALPAEIRRIWYDLCTELILGQRADLTGAAAGRRDRQHADHIARLKSGRYTIERPLQLGAAAAGGPPAVRESLRRCGVHIGSAFALRDDQLGVWGDPTITGKPADDDLAEGKATVILALAEQQLTGDAARALERLGTQDLRDTDVTVVRDALTACGVPQMIEELIAQAVDSARACLDEAPLTAEGVTGLKVATDKVAWRTA